MRAHRRERGRLCIKSSVEGIGRGCRKSPPPSSCRAVSILFAAAGCSRCRDLETGKLVYEGRLNAPGGYYASPVAARGHLYLASDKGTLTVVKAGDALEALVRNELGGTRLRLASHRGWHPLRPFRPTLGLWCQREVVDRSPYFWKVR